MAGALSVLGGIGGLVGSLTPILNNQMNIKNQQFLTMLPLLMTSSKEGDNTSMIILMMMMSGTMGNTSVLGNNAQRPVIDFLNPNASTTATQWTDGFIPLPTTNDTIIPFWGNPLWFIQKPYQMIKF